MLSIFAVPKRFTGQLRVIQRNAIRSWLQLGDDVEVIIFSENSEVAKEAKDLGVHSVENVRLNDLGTPLLDHVFKQAWLSSSNDSVCYVNADIILMSDFREALRRVAERFDEFLMVGRRHDLTLDEEIGPRPEWERSLRRRTLERGRPHSFSGIDYLAFNTALLVDMPPFTVGRPGWDNWFIHNALRQKVKVVDASKVVVAIHQDHDYSHIPTGETNHRQGPEAHANLHLAGDDAWRFSILSANRYLTPRRIRRPLSIKRLRSQFWAIFATELFSKRAESLQRVLGRN